MRNSYHTCKLSKLTINFSKVWPRQILDLGKQFDLMIRLENVLKTSLQDFLKMSWRGLCNTSWRRLENVFEDVLKRSWKRLEDVLKTSWRRLEDVWPRRIYWSWSRLLEEVLETSSEDAWLRRIYSSWSRPLLKTKTKDVFKTSSSRRMFAGLNLPTVHAQLLLKTKN